MKTYDVVSPITIGNLTVYTGTVNLTDEEAAPHGDKIKVSELQALEVPDATQDHAESADASADADAGGSNG